MLVSQLTLQRRGFTLMEMMLVIGVLAVVAGIGFGVVLTSQEGTKIQAAENLVANMVRQARNTALSSGAPVELTIAKSQAANQWQITGISQTIVASDNFEFFTNDLPGDDFGKFAERRTLETTDDRPVSGLSGLGWQPAAMADGAPGQIRSIRIDKSRPVMRRPGDGFYISCWFKPPPLRSPQVVGKDVGLQLSGTAGGSGSQWNTEEHDGKPVRFIPLIALSASQESPTPFNAVAALQLELWQVRIQNNPTKDHGNGIHPTAYFWVPVGVLAGERVIFGTPKEFKTGVVRNRIDNLSWTQIGLSLNGDRLTLFIDEEPASAPLQIGALLSENQVGNQDEDLEQFELPKEMRDKIVAYADRKDTYVHIMHSENKPAPGIIDNVRVLGLGRERPVRLPRGVIVGRASSGDLAPADFKIIADGTSVEVLSRRLPIENGPDGPVAGEVSWQSSNNDNSQTIQLQTTTGKKKHNARILINGAGRVSSNIYFGNNSSDQSQESD